MKEDNKMFKRFLAADTINEKIKTQKEVEKWLLSDIKKVGNTIESSGRGDGKYNALIEGYKYLVSKRPEGMNTKIVTDFLSL